MTTGRPFFLQVGHFHFAQELGTAMKVSPTRLARAREAVEAALAHEGITVTTTA